MIDTLSERRSALEQAYPVWSELTLWERFAEAARKYPDSPLLYTDGVPATYSEVAEKACAAAEVLHAMGVKEGTHVALIMDNSPEFVILTFALARLGAVKIPLNTKLSLEEWRYLLQQSGAEQLLLMLNDPVQAARLSPLCAEFERDGHDPRFPCLRTIVLLGGAARGHITSWPEFPPVNAPRAAAPVVHVPHKPSDIIYTSGCTSRPKGVLLTHDMLWRNAYANCLNRAFEPGLRIFIPLPLFHVYGYVEGLLAAILVGGTILLTREKCTAEHMLDILERYRANDILAVPSLMMALIKSSTLPSRDLSALRSVYCSASVCPDWIWPAIQEKLGVEEVITGYGMTEVAGATLQTRPEDPPEIPGIYVGRILPAGAAGAEQYGGALVQYRVIDPASGLECPTGTSGELWCRGLVVTDGYYHNPKETAAMFDSDGWLRTGDVGCFHENGYLQLEGRTHEVFKVNGEKVSPKLIENVIANCSSVRYVEVVGIPDPKSGETGAAFLELEPGADPEVVISYCKNHLGRFQVPKHYFFSPRSSWPQTATGKVQKSRLRQKALDLLHKVHAEGNDTGHVEL